jgi:uncharacterized protein (TIGR03000 family)
MVHKLSSMGLVSLLSLCLTLTCSTPSKAQVDQTIVGPRMTSMTVPEQPSVGLPSNLPTYMTTINYPLIYGSYAMWPYAAPLSFTNGASMPSSLGDISMRPTPVVTKAYQPALAPPAVSALINVACPSNADLYFQGMRIGEPGTLRRFTTPELNPLMAYTYDVRAVWMQGGRAVSESQRILVRAGDRLTLTFPGTPAASPGPVITPIPTAPEKVRATPPESSISPRP